MNCPKCMHPIKDGQKFCPACGAKIQPVTLDLDKTVAADPIEMGEQGYAQPPQQNAWQQPVQPEPQQNVWQQPVQPEPQQNAWQPPVQPEPQGYPAQYQQSYGSYTAVAEKKRKGSGKLIVIIVIAAVLVVGTVAGIFAFRACGGISYQAAITDMMQMISEGKYEDAIDKYSIEGKANLTESQKQKLAMMQGMTYTADVDEKNAKIYKKGDAQFDSYCSRMTSDTAKRDQITEIVEVPVTVNVKGTVFGSPVDQSNPTTFVMAKMNGQWKMPLGSMIN